MDSVETINSKLDTLVEAVKVIESCTEEELNDMHAVSSIELEHFLKTSKGDEESSAKVEEAKHRLGVVLLAKDIKYAAPPPRLGSITDTLDLLTQARSEQEGDLT